MLEDPGKRLRRDRDADDQDERCAHGGQGPDDRPVQGEASERTPSEDGDQPDPGDRRCQAQAERDDQGKTESDAMQSDRGEKDDQSRRARQKACRDPHPEDALGRQLVAGV